MKNHDLLVGFRDLRLQVETQTDVEAQRGINNRRLILQTKRTPELADIILAIENQLDAFERSLVEKRGRHAIEAARASFLATLDSMIRRLSSS